MSQPACDASLDPLHRLELPVYARRSGSAWTLSNDANDANDASGAATAFAPALLPQQLGDAGFLRAHGVRAPYVACALANGISGVELVSTMAAAGMLSFFGAGGLALAEVEAGLDAIARRVGRRAPFGANLVHHVGDPEAELAVARLFVAASVPATSVSGFLTPTPAVVLLAARGLRRDEHGAVVRTRSLFAKVSRPDLVAVFLRPAPDALLEDLVRRGLLDASEQAIARTVPLATDITLEGDSGGHTDGLPTASIVAEAVRSRHQIRGAEHVRIGAAGGIGTPEAIAASFTAGAGYVVTGSINQASVEADTSSAVKELLAAADLQHTDTAPSAHGFGFGTEVQVLRRGTLFPSRARRLEQLYRDHAAWESIPEATRGELEARLFRMSYAEVWREVRGYLEARSRDQLALAERDPRARLARVFQWYLGKSSDWAQRGDGTRSADFQIWCGPAMGAFNRWVRGSWLEPLAARGVAVMARALLHGAAAHMRARILAFQGVTRDGGASPPMRGNTMGADG